jgi:hypothetical protein
MDKKLQNKEHVLECLLTPPKDYKILWMKDGPPLIRTPDMTDDQWAEIRHQHMMKHGDF